MGGPVNCSWQRETDRCNLPECPVTPSRGRLDRRSLLLDAVKPLVAAKEELVAHQSRRGGEFVIKLVDRQSFKCFAAFEDVGYPVTPHDVNTICCSHQGGIDASNALQPLLLVVRLAGTGSTQERMPVFFCRK